jgi:hypothetical protein
MLQRNFLKNGLFGGNSRFNDAGSGDGRKLVSLYLWCTVARPCRHVKYANKCIKPQQKVYSRLIRSLFLMIEEIRITSEEGRRNSGSIPRKIWRRINIFSEIKNNFSVYIVNAEIGARSTLFEGCTVHGRTHRMIDRARIIPVLTPSLPSARSCTVHPNVVKLGAKKL